MYLNLFSSGILQYYPLITSEYGVHVLFGRFDFSFELLAFCGFFSLPTFNIWEEGMCL